MATRQIPWAPIFAEGVAIVVSILLAFGIQAWWGKRQDMAFERRVLERLENGLAESHRLALDQSQNILGGLGRLQHFTSLSQTEAALIPPDSADLYLQSLWVPYAIQFNSTALTASVEDSRQFVTSDTALGNALAAWQDEVSSVEARHQTLNGIEQEVLQAVAKYPEVQHRLVYGDDSPIPGSVLGRIRADEQVMSRATRRGFNLRIQRSLISQYLSATEEALELVRARLRSLQEEQSVTGSR